MLKLLLLAAALIAAAIPASAQAPQHETVRMSMHIYQCALPDCVMVGGAALDAVLTSNQSRGERLTAIEGQLGALQRKYDALLAAGGCAKVDVTEPSKLLQPARLVVPLMPPPVTKVGL